MYQIIRNNCYQKLKLYEYLYLEIISYFYNTHKTYVNSHNEKDVSRRILDKADFT